LVTLAEGWLAYSPVIATAGQLLVITLLAADMVIGWLRIGHWLRHFTLILVLAAGVGALRSAGCHGCLLLRQLVIVGCRSLAVAGYAKKVVIG